MKFFLLYFLLSNKNKKGFTLIELLIVIAILGVLAASLLAFIDPFEQLARTRDIGRVSALRQLGKALEAQSTVLGRYVSTSDVNDPSNSTNYNYWQSYLVRTGHIKLVANANITSVGCSPGTYQRVEGGFCYADGITDNNNTAINASDEIVYTRPESKSYKSKCPSGTTNVWLVFTLSRGGKVEIACMASVNAPWPTDPDTTYQSL